MIHYELGARCHWCGEIVEHPWTAKCGKHLYCRNNGKCKMAHLRAFARYSKSVTAGSGRRSGQAAPSISNGNGEESPASRTSSPAISRKRIRKGNARKGRK